MARWEKCQRLQGPLLEQMKGVYGPKFPIEVRHYIANWIEHQSWSEIDPNNPAHEPNARHLYKDMLSALNEKVQCTTNFLTRCQLEALYAHMRNEYISCPLQLVNVVTTCLIQEAELLRKQEEFAPSPSSVMHQNSSNVTLIQQHLQNVLPKTGAMETMYRTLASKQESFQLHYQETCRLDMMLRQGSIPPDQVPKYRDRKQLVDQILTKEVDEMKMTLDDITRQFMDSVEVVTEAQKLVIHGELTNWRNSQRLFSWEDDTGRQELNTIQHWCETLAELLWRLRQLAKQLEILRTRTTVSVFQQAASFISFEQRITALLHELITESFVLEKQPPQVIKTANRFSATVRLLVGNKLQVHLSAPEVMATIINDKQARSLVTEPNKQITNQFSTGEILNNQKAMEYNAQTGTLQCNFNFMQLKKIKRNSERRAAETVTEEKFTLLFRSRFTIAGGEMEVPVRCESLPVVVIVHVTQQPAAEATIFWDNAFAENNRAHFVVPDHVPWPKVADALGYYFLSHTGRGLTPQNLDYLGRKLMGITNPEEDIKNMTVSRQQMCKDQLRTRTFTFWEWFYKHLDLIKTTLKREWQEELIQGFMDKTEAQNVLLQVQSGTFLVRFSDSEAGGVSVTWVAENEVGDKQIFRLAPWGKHDLSIRSFADRLHDLTQLVFLYPNKLKDDVFCGYYSPPLTEMRTDGYLHTPLHTNVIIPGGPGRFPMGSTPASPAPSLYSFPPMTPGSVSSSFNGVSDPLPDLGNINLDEWVSGPRPGHTPPS